MALTTSIPAFRQALRTGLRARSGLAGVTITNAPVAAEDIAPRMIRIGGVPEGEAQNRTFSRLTVQESYTVEGTIWWVATGTFGDAAIDAAEAGAFGLYGEIEDFLRASSAAPRVGGVVMEAQVGIARYLPTLFDTGTGVVLEFRIAVKNELTP